MQMLTVSLLQLLESWRVKGHSGKRHCDGGKLKPGFEFERIPPDWPWTFSDFICICQTSDNDPRALASRRPESSELCCRPALLLRYRRLPGYRSRWRAWTVAKLSAVLILRGLNRLAVTVWLTDNLGVDSYCFINADCLTTAWPGDCLVPDVGPCQSWRATK